MNCKFNSNYVSYVPMWSKSKIQIQNPELKDYKATDKVIFGTIFFFQSESE